jgi:hypothetical protein
MSISNQPPATANPSGAKIVWMTLGLGIAIGLLAAILIGLFFKHYPDVTVKAFITGVGIGVGIVVMVSVMNWLITTADKTRNQI